MALFKVVPPYVQGIFHGTGISLFQNIKTGTDGIMRQMPDILPDLLRKQIPTPPESYTTLTLVTAKQGVVIPPTQSTLTCDHKLVNTTIEEEAKWQSNTRQLISEGVHTVDDPISWAAFQSNVSYRVFNCILVHFIPLPVFIFYSFFFFILFYLLFFHVHCTGLFFLFFFFRE